MTLGSPRRRPAATLLAAAWGVAVSFGLALIPTYSGGETLVQENGRGVVVWLIIPVVLLLIIHVASPWLAIAAWALLAAFVVVTGFSVGLFYLPALVAAGIGLFWPRPGQRPMA
jgi:hypothetical protein